MPRDLTDLMERATATAPPEPHAAADITTLAVRRHRRRTTNLAAGLALAVVAAGALGYGVTRGKDTAPEPAGKVRYGQQLSLSDAVAADSVPGFRELHYAVPPVDEQPQSRRMDRLGLPNPAFAEYRDVDADGRLIVVRRAAGATSPLHADVFAGTHSTTSMAESPPPPAKNGTNPNAWVPSFVGDGRLLWLPVLPVLGETDPGARVTDLTGSRDQALVFDHSNPTPGYGGDEHWVAGDRLLFVNPDIRTNHLKAAPTVGLISLALDDPSRPTTVVDHVVAAGASDDAVGWVTRDGHGYLGAAGGPVSSFALPLDPGCTVFPWADQMRSFAVTQGLMAFAEQCGNGRSRTYQPVVVDGSGRLVLHVDAPSSAGFALDGTSFAFIGVGAPGQRTATYRVDLGTGAMAVLGGEFSSSGPPVVAGRYVLWHDSRGYHVGEFTG